MLTYFINFDYAITKFLSNLIPHNIIFNYFFSFFSLKGASILVWLIVILIVVILEERKYPGISKRDLKFIILFFSSFFLTLLLNDHVFKNIFHRLRPILNTKYFILNTYSCPTDFSFPSTHAATAFAAATILIYFDKKRRWFYYSVAVLISFSRIYLGCHYFLDVIIGALIGLIISKILLKFSVTNI
jgi:undecaprenyl-diphosphatase